MKKDKLHMFDGIVCICMKSEENKWKEQCAPQFEKLGCLDRVIRHYGDLPEDKKHLRGCEFAHYNVLKLCKEKGYRMPLILESDFYFRIGDPHKKWIHGIFDYNLLKKSVDSLSKVSWKLFYLGGHLKKCDNAPWPNILKVQCELAHAYSVNHVYYDEIISTVERNLNDRVDWVYSRNYFGNLADYCYMTPTIMVIQHWWKKEKWRTSRMWRVFRNKLGYEHKVLG